MRLEERTRPRLFASRGKQPQYTEELQNRKEFAHYRTITCSQCSICNSAAIPASCFIALCRSSTYMARLKPFQAATKLTEKAARSITCHRLQTESLQMGVLSGHQVVHDTLRRPGNETVKRYRLRRKPGWRGLLCLYQPLFHQSR